MRLVCFKGLFIFTMLMLSLSSCTDDWRRGRSSDNWSASDPTSIPYNIRMKEYKTGNLVPNFSFEEGTPLSSDTSIYQIIRRWEIIGDHVKLIENKDDSILASDGKRAVCISMASVNETESVGEGVLSDFIPVLPGNYDFSLNIKAQNIKPQLNRFNSVLLDAIHIRLYFFNSKKEPIESGIADPLTGNLLDNGFKGYSLANFHFIENLPWTEIQAETFHFPYPDGDLPDHCRYVKIFIGLKGSGTLWIDNINFRFSKWNFTAKERMSWHKDSVYSRTSLLIPTPQFAEFRQNTTLISAGYEQVLYPSVVMLQPPTELNQYTLEYLSGELRKTLVSSYPECHIHTSYELTPQLLHKSSVVFLLTSFSQTDTNKSSDILPGFSNRPQGYLISDTIIHDKKIIILAASDEYGLYYAATTAARLMDHETGLYSHSHIIDFPLYTGRGVTISGNETQNIRAADIDFLSFYRFNNAYLHYNIQDNDTVYQQQSRSIDTTLKFLQENSAMKFGIIINPYSCFNSKHDSMIDSARAQKNWQPNEKGAEEIIQLIKPAFQSGASLFILQLNPVDFVGTSFNKSAYVIYSGHNTIQSAHAKVINNIHQWLSANYKNSEFAFLPPWFANDLIDNSFGTAAVYFSDMGFLIPGDVNIIWTGNSLKSLRLDNADVFRFQNIIERPFIYRDNSMNARASEELTTGGYPAFFPSKSRLCNLFEPFDVIFPAEFHQSSSQLISQLHPGSRINQIRLATLSDYLWNPGSYVPEISLWKVMINLYGKETAVSLIQFSDMYFSILGNIITMEKEGKGSKTLIKSTEIALSNLNTQLTDIQKILMFTDPDLYTELEQMSDSLTFRLQNIKQEPKQTEDTETK
jgi:hypothetical protein